MVKALDSQSRVQRSKPLGGSKVDSVVHELRISGNVIVKSSLPFRCGSLALRQLSLIHKRGP